MNVIYVDFRKNKKNELQNEWEKVYKLDKLMMEKLTLVQLNKLMGTTKYIDRAIKCKKLSKNKKVHRYADEIIKTINLIEGKNL